MEIVLQYKDNSYCVKVYDQGKIIQAGIRKEKKKAVKLFNELVKDFLGYGKEV